MGFLVWITCHRRTISLETKIAIVKTVLVYVLYHLGPAIACLVKESRADTFPGNLRQGREARYGNTLLLGDYPHAEGDGRRGGFSESDQPGCLRLPRRLLGRYRAPQIPCSCWPGAPLSRVCLNCII
jgi:hypothetical protein